MSIQDPSEPLQEPSGEDGDTNNEGQNEEEVDGAEKEEQGRYWLFNLLELLTPMPEFDEEEDEEGDDESSWPANETEGQDANTSS